MLVMFHTKLRRPAEMRKADFYALWASEAEGTFAALEAGVIKDIWKVAGNDEAIGVMEVADAESLDRGLFELAIWRLGYTHVVESIEWTLLRPYQEWAHQLTELASGGHVPPAN